MARHRFPKDGRRCRFRTCTYEMDQGANPKKQQLLKYQPPQKKEQLLKYSSATARTSRGSSLSTPTRSLKIHRLRRLRLHTARAKEPALPASRDSQETDDARSVPWAHPQKNGLCSLSSTFAISNGWFPCGFPQNPKNALKIGTPNKPGWFRLTPPKTATQKMLSCGVRIRLLQ